MTWSSAIASGRRADSADTKASVDGFPPLGGTPSTSASSYCSAMRASMDGFLPTGEGPISIRSCSTIAPGDGAASMGEIVLEQQLDQSRNRLRKAGLARSTNTQRQLIRD